MRSTKVESGRLLQGELVALINYLTQAFFVIVTIGNVFSVLVNARMTRAPVRLCADRRDISSRLR